MKLIFLSAFFISTFASSQEPATGIFPVKEGAIYYENVAAIDSSTKENIYKAIKSWGVDAFKSQKDIIQADDKELGLLGYKFFFTEWFETPKIMGIGPADEWQYWCTLKILIKDNKVKITLSDIDLRDVDYGNISSILSFRQEMDEKLKKSMAGKNYRERYYDAAKENFKAAHYHILALIDNIIAAAKKGKSEFDF